MQLHDLCNAFEEYLREHGRSERTIESYARGLRLFRGFAVAERGAIDVNQWTPATLTHYAGFLKADHAPASCALYLTAISTLLRFLIRHQLIANPALDSIRQELADLIRGAAGNAKLAPLHQRLPEAEFVGALLRAVDPSPSLPTDMPESIARRKRLEWLRNRAILYTLASSGMRVSELAGLTRGDLDRKQHAAHVLGKGSKWRLTPISDAGWKRIEEYLGERRDGASRGALSGLPLFARHDSKAGGKPLPLSARSVETILMHYAQESGVLRQFHLTPHSLRHYVATVFLANTGDLAMTQELLGHADPRTTRRYADVDKAGLIAAHRATFSR